LFRKMTSKKELLYLGVVVGISVGLFSVTHSIIWLYLMALLIFLQGFIFGKPTKKDIIVDGVGLVLLILVFTIGQHSF
jgi:hypothetical protein